MSFVLSVANFWDELKLYPIIFLFQRFTRSRINIRVNLPPLKLGQGSTHCVAALIFSNLIASYYLVQSLADRMESTYQCNIARQKIL